MMSDEIDRLLALNDDTCAMCGDYVSGFMVDGESLYCHEPADGSERTCWERKQAEDGAT